MQVSQSTNTVTTAAVLLVLCLVGVDCSNGQSGTSVIGKDCTVATAAANCTLNTTVCDPSSLKCKCALGLTGTANCSVVIGMACTKTNVCTNVLPNTTCEAAKCECANGYFGQPGLKGGQTCTAVVGKNCTNDTECTQLLSNTKCTSKHCACANGYSGTTCTEDSSATTALVSIKTVMFLLAVYITVF